MISLEKARLRLARLWFIGVGIIFLLLVAQSSAGNVYEGRLEEVWSWALPTFIPTLSLLLSVLGADAIVQVGDSSSNTGILRRSFYSIAYWLSVFYLSLILATILLQPIAVSVNPSDKYSAADFLKRSQLWLSPVQGLVISAMGTLFFSKESASRSQDTEKNK
jgi:hypothetical protein